MLFCVLVAGVIQFCELRQSLNRQELLVGAAVAERDRLLQMVNEETGVRGYVATGDAQFLQIYDGAAPLQNRDEAIIDSAFAAVPTLKASTSRAQTRANLVRDYFRKEIDLERVGNVSGARANLKNGKVLFDRLRAADAVAEAAVSMELRARRTHTEFLADAGFVVGIVVCFALLIGALAFIVVARSAKAYRQSSLRDPLTGLANRAGAKAALESLSYDFGSEAFGLVFIDLDGFKKINDTFGHAAGDAILRAVATRLRGELRDTDEVCRLGGDEFLCIIAPPIANDQVPSIAARLRKAVMRPYKHAGEDFIIGCSVGVSIYPQHGTTPQGLLERADLAMYDAKAAGGGVRTAS